ncbi:VOC family protein [Oceanobacillus rekensis]|uniref:VOC family protein n=1 Tax=Oceanobacillus rekensis TaxID=937927 RepID=UPI000B452E9E|nr:VOC family protein [Oceanobacillus rekensis]
MKTEYRVLPEIAKLGHVAVVSTDLEKSLWFFKEVVGLEETEEVDGVHYLRAWGDFEHHTLSLTAGDESRVDHIAFKTKRPEDVGYFTELLEEAEVKIEKVPAGVEVGQGEAIRFQLPTGHNFELYFEMDQTPADPSRKARLKNQTYKAWRKGISPRRFDHVNIGTNEDANLIIDFLIEKLGFKVREYFKLPNDAIGSAWLSVTPLVHDIAVMSTPDMKSPHELHHISYFTDNAQDILRAADMLSEEGFKFVGPGKHGITQAVYLYVIDPGSGLRLELFSNSYLILEPDWKPVEWSIEEAEFAVTYWGEQTGGASELDKPTINAGGEMSIKI